MATETNLILPVPAAEPVVGEHRMRYDPTAAQRVPAHITVLAPFLIREVMTVEDVDGLRALFAAVAPFEFTLATVADFPGVLYLAPEPAQPFIELTEAVWRRWPYHPPYGGAYEEIVPHLTVAVGDSSWSELRRELLRRLPISGTAHEVWWIARQRGEGWRCVERFALRGASRTR
jgi:2'-5' RNA ligase